MGMGCPGVAKLSEIFKVGRKVLKIFMLSYIHTWLGAGLIVMIYHTQEHHNLAKHRYLGCKMPKRLLMHALKSEIFISPGPQVTTPRPAKKKLRPTENVKQH